MSIADFSSHNTSAPERDSARVTGKTAFVLGNGPSLARIDLTALSPYAAIGLNAAYRHWRTIGWRPRYYACLDLVVGLSHKDAIAELIEEGRIECFLLRANLIEALGPVGRNPRVVSYEELRERAPELAAAPITTGSHAALWAATMGYDQIVLLGVDAAYKEVVEGAAQRQGIELEIVRDGANPNYYFEGYQAPGDRFNLPNPRPDLHVNAWRRAARTLRAAGVSAFNGNDASAVRCFPFVDVEAFLGDGAAPRAADESLDAFAGDTAPALPSPQERREAFLRAYGVKGGATAALCTVAFALWAAVFTPSAALATFAGATLLALLGAAAAGLYARFAILEHLHRQSEEIGALRAQLGVVEEQLLKARKTL
jgi:hypothetical protein